jgi:hypothetical protein
VKESARAVRVRAALFASKMKNSINSALAGKAHRMSIHRGPGATSNFENAAAATVYALSKRRVLCFRRERKAHAYTAKLSRGA